MVAALVADKMRPGMILFFGSGLVFVCRYSDPERNAGRFSNKGMITVAYCSGK